MNAGSSHLIYLAGLWTALAASVLGQTDPNLPPLPPSPIEEFRQWLTMPANQFEKALEEYPEENRRTLRAKIDFYKNLPPSERERRLMMLDLRWYLRPLMTNAVADRARQLAMVPDHCRALVSKRIEQWDRLSPAVQQQLLQSDMTMPYFTRVRHRGVDPLHNLNAQTRQQLSERLKSWQGVPRGEREKFSRQFEQFFELSEEERRKTLSTLSEAERQEIQRSLDTLLSMPEEQKRSCIESFQKLAKMSPPEQILFLHNAARWQAMTPEERESWKSIVFNLPPLPPGDDMPPLPADAPLASSNAPALPR